jgi:hypothetical protein
MLSPPTRTVLVTLARALMHCFCLKTMEMKHLVDVNHQ